ncbi:HPr kinase/phosphorylase [Mycoplasma haemocanis str. Illinois]|uniref:HPr kinase/phosphorylase n=1 Tax=Mycoplasma haemocanis (strain Illinois) TaxID=1111676 RepID=H6N5Y3_MYCHN|nr:HPr(Ser) kinase/phosphatase [Mycoplasma haemocanis]AEW44898.1 HPr kinase/phosphorylase [Mycoplasma haemocanis str. Illinois]
MIKVLSIYKRFNGKYLNRTPDNEQREILFPGFNRLGMELNGCFLNEQNRSVVCWGKQESNFLDLFEENKQIEILSKILETDPPLFLLSNNFRHSDLLHKLNKDLNGNRSALICMGYSTLEIFTLIGTWIAKTFAKWTTVHGVVLNVYGEGVLITGEAGVGKSEAAAELLKMNHLFLGDDAIDIARIGNTIVAKANPFSEGFMHIRGLGILNMREMYGGMKMIDETRITMVVNLKDQKDENKLHFENVGEEINYRPLLEVPLPYYVIPVTSGRKISEIIELAVIDMKLKRKGYSAAQEMNRKYKKLIAANQKSSNDQTKIQ